VLTGQDAALKTLGMRHEQELDGWREQLGVFEEERNVSLAAEAMSRRLIDHQEWQLSLPFI
jgi:hypothetical protein